jgi:hypothetical protein
MTELAANLVNLINFRGPRRHIFFNNRSLTINMITCARIRMLLLSRINEGEKLFVAYPILTDADSKNIQIPIISTWYRKEIQQFTSVFCLESPTSLIPMLLSFFQDL